MVFHGLICPSKVSLVSLMWILPLLELLHNLEETMFMDSFWRDHPGIQSLPFYKFVQATDLQFTVSVVILTVLVFLITYMAVKHPKGNWMNLFMVVASLIFINAIIHIIQALIFRSYVPGLITGLLILPYSLILFHRIFQEKLINKSSMALILLMGLILQIPIIIAALSIGKILIMV